MLVGVVVGGCGCWWVWLLVGVVVAELRGAYVYCMATTTTTAQPHFNS